MSKAPVAADGGDGDLPSTSEGATQSLVATTSIITKPPSPTLTRKGRSGSLFSKLSFLHNSADDAAKDPHKDAAKPPEAHEAAAPETHDPSRDITSSRNPIMQSVFGAQSQARKRKGSLRKTALLGMRRDRRPTNTDPTKRSNLVQHEGTAVAGLVVESSSPTDDAVSPSDEAISPGSDNHAHEFVSEEKHTGAALNPNVIVQVSPPTTMPRNGPASTDMTSPTPSFTSTTDEDTEILVSSPLSHLSTPTSASLPPPSTTASPSPSPPSSEASASLILPPRRRSNIGIHPKSPLGSPLAASESPLEGLEDEWDYTETAWWGWVVLIVTWIVFVVGMGSCFGVWSWAWDVGEKADAPPDLEDDPTLPIVGYYPALIVLTSVVSWVWVVVAWVGMKYFKHAKIQGD